ncbi:Tyrosine kinase domain containing protein [Ceratobasidium theobromae]|uniref:Tyrosine kinase domain containing protein n=1 Tax=Ceratobasidium theobromae TaxID=1582974 RepID=A0A5N5QD54_9AGAM|nr:Tyrosine kinase domain containing protein [Ceratobasidium theobromae]
MHELMKRVGQSFSEIGLLGDELIPVSADVKNLSGNVSCSDSERKNTLGYSVGWWRQMYKYKSIEPIDIASRSFKGSLSRGIFARRAEVTIKGMAFPPRVSSRGSVTLSAKQCAYHEIALLRQLKHENICDFMGYDNTHGGTTEPSAVPSIITEFCSNGKLKEYCARKSQELDFAAQLDLVMGVAKAVDYLHQRVPDGSIAHGNLSTETILVSQSGVAKLSGFEFACQYQHSDNPMLARVVYVPPLAFNPSRWHAPELFNETSDTLAPYPTQYSDLWALGCVFLAVLNGQDPYERYDLPGAISCIAEGVKPFSPDVCSSEAWNIVSSLWAAPPHMRISAAQAVEMISALPWRPRNVSVPEFEFLTVTFYVFRIPFA